MSKAQTLAVLAVLLLIAGGVVGYVNGGEQSLSRVEIAVEPKAAEPVVEDYSE
ncbi:MAG: hypothetical protein AAFX04_06805 [Pseudomonadota bacterium]